MCLQSNNLLSNTILVWKSVGKYGFLKTCCTLCNMYSLQAERMGNCCCCCCCGGLSPHPIPDDCREIIVGEWSDGATSLVVASNGNIKLLQPGLKVELPGKNWARDGRKLSFSTPPFCCFDAQHFVAEFDPSGPLPPSTLHGFPEQPGIEISNWN